MKDKVTDNDIVENIKNILSEEPTLNDIQFDEEDVFVEGKQRNIFKFLLLL